MLTMSLTDGGHLTHGSKVNLSGKTYNIVHYALDEDERINYDEMEELALNINQNDSCWCWHILEK